MSKKIGITLIVIALVVCIAYTIVCVTTFEDCPVETTKPSAVVEKEYKAELIYNSLMYNTGAYEYSVQAYVNIDHITKDVTLAERAARKQQSKNAISSIKADFEKRGYKIEKDEDYFVSATIAYYESYDELALANGETGYDYQKSTAKSYKGLLFNDVVSERTTVFEEREGTVLNVAEAYLNEIDGIAEGDVSLVFNYGTMYKTTTIASDADQIYKLTDEETGISTNIHEFRMTDGNRARVITLVQHTPNSYTWYLSVLVVSLLLAGIIILAKGAKRSK
ncbi:MAG: hypothetical protein IJ033_04605 [Clostridia bacterium]|nr:hypothetical protein [Clostridia bacterium]